MQPPAKKSKREFWARKRRPVTTTSRDEGLVKRSFLTEGETLPLVITPVQKDLNFNAWVESHRQEIHKNVLEYGAVLFRGFKVTGATDFENFNDAMGLELMKYMEGATPRSKVTAKVATSTRFPPELSIFPHNELCYVNTWPRHILFCCVKAPHKGGATPIVDVRKLHKRLHPKITEKFKNRGWMLVRNFGEGFGRHWRDSFHLETREELEAYCIKADIQLEWLGPERMRTKQVRPVVADHPITGDRLWFNHIAFWHLSSLASDVREFMLGNFGEDGLPFASYYGDGSPIEDEVIEEMREATYAESVSFPWQVGDILMIDNMLVGHGRESYEGDRLVFAVLASATSKRFLAENDPAAVVENLTRHP